MSKVEQPKDEVEQPKKKKHLNALGQPNEEPYSDIQSDFASEHDDTAVDEEIVIGTEEGESESPRGWAGMEE